MFSFDNSSKQTQPLKSPDGCISSSNPLIDKWCCKGGEAQYLESDFIQTSYEGNPCHRKMQIEKILKYKDAYQHPHHWESLMLAYSRIIVHESKFHTEFVDIVWRKIHLKHPRFVVHKHYLVHPSTIKRIKN